ncbi:MAG: DUF3488 domain-containing transglutaminase family protein [Gammaproteobacteria bacterium]|nr:DUF3488 domain-containing transglutaminase family protein [Gammaproteobacteria bacterium]
MAVEARPLALPQHRALFVAGVLTLAIWALHMPIWVALMAMGLAVYRREILHGRLSLPAPRLKALMVVGCVVAIAAYYREFGLESTTTLLLCMYMLKFIECYDRRSARVLSLTGIYTAAAVLLFDQGMFTSFGVLLVLLANLAALSILEHQSLLKIQPGLLAMTLRTAVLAVPLGALLFVGFPRLAPIWSLPLSSDRFQGLATDMRMGDLSNLATQDKTAFRVTFLGDAPAPPYYWRGMTLSQYDQGRWFSPEQPNLIDNLDNDAAIYRYRVNLEPSGQPLLFSLGAPSADLPVNTMIKQDSSLRAKSPITANYTYELRSTAAPPVSEIKQYEQQALTQLSDAPEMIAMVAGWPDEPVSARVERVRAWFQAQPFLYSLRPPAYADEFVDEFLFDEQVGFCSHYAAATTMLLRASGIPARIVTGYLGGKPSRDGEYWRVSQLDAHAWVEYHDGMAWHRLDPTTWIAPERILNSPADFLTDSDDLLDRGAFSFAPGSWTEALAWQLDAARYYWLNNVANLSENGRTAMASELWAWLKQYGIGLMAGVAVLLGVIVAGWAYRQRPDPLTRALNRLAKRHGERRAQETLSQYCRRIGVDMDEQIALHYQGRLDRKALAATLSTRATQSVS